MELLIISENKIKISLTKNDLDGYKISCDDIDYDTTETRRVVWSLLDDVKKQVGFDAGKSRIFVQMYPSRDGGCELYISKLGKQSSRSLVNAEQKGDTLSKEDRKKDYYIFDGINEMLAVCKELCYQGYKGSSDVYVDDDGRFFLCTESEKGFEFMLEFGLHQASEATELYIKEHCREICTQRAVETLGVL